MTSTNEEIVISGIGGFFPGCKNTAEWKEKLFGNEIDLVEKWSKNGDSCNVFGSVPSDRFDNSYFGVHRLQTVYMDPLHRLSLERTFEALIDAGINPNSIRGKKIGCYVGMTLDENNSLFLESVVSGFGVTGHARAMFANRISYWLNLKGPSVTYDSNWITGFEVIRLACDAIKKGECEGAIVGSANLIFFPEFHDLYEDLEIISSDGKTRSFAEDANGYGRSDGVVICYIQKASDAKRCYGTIVSVNTQFNGNTENELYKIDNQSMKEFLTEFYSNSPVKPEQIDYLETYGCGLKDVDKAELDAIEEVYFKSRSKPLLIGSVKTQAGHAEACSTLFSLVKVILAMEEEVIPATLNVGKLNPEIEGLHNGHFEVVTTNRKWNSDYAAINAIGINNYFAHMILKGNPKKKVPVTCDIPRILPVSTRTEETVQKSLATLLEKPEDPEFDRLVFEVFGRHVPLHMFRGYLLKSEEPKQEFSFMDGKKRAIWFVFSGMGSQWMGMLSDLMKFPVVAQSITNSHNILMSRGVDLMHILTAEDKTVFDNILNCFVGIAAMQIAITDLLHALGIVPDGIIGHSVGELACAYADGCMTAEQMILSAYSRGRASLEATLIKGMMAAVGLGYNQIKDQLPETIEVACHNGPESCTISGPVEDMEKYVKELQDKGVFARLVNVADIAYHSRYIKPAAPLLHKYLKEVLPEPSLRSRKWVTTSNKAENWNTELSKYSSADYHTNNLLSSVLFEEGCKHIPKDSILIEIAPHGLLQAILKRSMKDSISVPLTNRSAKSGVDFLLQSLGKLFLLGMDLNFAELYPPINFPVSRNTPTLSDLAGWNYTEKWEQSTYQRLSDKIVNDTVINLYSEKFEKFLGNKIKGNVVIPFGLYLNLLYKCLDPEVESYLFENLHFRKHAVLAKNSEMTIHQVFHSCSGEFEFWSNKELVLSGRVIQPDDTKVFEEEVVANPNEDCLEFNETEIYDELKHRGYDYPSSYWKLRKLKLTNKGSVATIDSGDQWTELIDGIIQHQSVISGEKYQNILLPQKISQIWVNTKKVNADKKDVQVNYDYAIKTLSTDGIVIRDIEMSQWNVGETDLVLESVEYIPLEKLSFKDIEGALEFSIQLTRGNFITPGMETILVTELVSENNSFYEIVKKISNELIHLNVSVSTANSVKEIYVQQLYPQLIVLGDEPTKDLLEKISSSHVLLFTKTTNFALSFPGIIEMSRIIVNGEEYSVFRKAASTDVTIVDIENEKPNISDLKGGKARWFYKLMEAVKASKKQNRRVYLVCTSMPIEGFEYFIREIRQQPDTQNVRFIFNLDKYTGDLSPVFRKNLIISILKNGKLSTSIHQSIKYRSDDNSKTFSKESNQNRKIQYISLNLEDETINPSVKDNTVGNIDYSGIDSDGKRIMGLARIDESNSEIKVDPIFKWELPEWWSLSDSATVPHAFLSAYYMMLIKGKLQSGSNVLIHAGCSPIGMTAVGIALAYRCKVYATVFNKQQKAILLDRFTCISPNDIYLLDGTSFKANFMNSTSGQGARLVLNCLTGNYVRESMDCCGQLSSFVHYGKYDLDSGNSIGMARFMLNVSFYVVDLNNLVNLDTEIKQQLWELVVSNFEDYFILPLKWTVRSKQDIPDILRNRRTGLATTKAIFRTKDISSDNSMNSLTSNKFTCSPKSSYIVFGGNTEIWMNVVEWLIHRGAKQVVVSGDTNDKQKNLNRRLALYKKYFDAHINISRQKATTKDAVSQLVQDSSKLGPIDAVILLPNESETLQKGEHLVVENLIEALNKISPEASLINYIPTVAGICHNRANTGYKTYTVELTRDSDIRVGLNALNQIVVTGSGHTVMQEKIENHENIIGVGKFLPTLIEIIEDQKQSMVEPDMVQILTEGPTKYREVAPIFIIQGLAGKEEVKKMAQALLYPTYCTVMPCTPWPIEKLAEIYAEKIEKIYPKNVYNLVSLSTGGALMLEIATKLQERRKNVQLHLFFIDSAPKIAQEAIVQLGEETDYELNILRAIFNINDIKVLDVMKSFEHWEDRVKYCTKTYNQREEVLVKRGLMSVKHMLDDSKRYRPRGFAVTGGEVHLLRPSIMDQFDDCGLKEYCQREPLVKLVDGDHLSIICHPNTLDYINFHVDV